MVTNTVVNTATVVLTQADIDYARKTITFCYPHLDVHSGVYAELESAAMLGLVEAAARYNPDYGKTWMQYRKYRVIGAIRAAMRDETQQGFIGITGRGRNTQHIHLKTSRNVEHINTIQDNDSWDLDSILSAQNIQDLVADYCVEYCNISTAVKIIAIILGNAPISDVARQLKCSKAGVSNLLKKHRLKIGKYIKKRGISG